MHDIAGALWLFFSSPLAQSWLLGGLFVGAVYSLLRRKHRLELFLTTSIVIIPPIVVLPFMARMINSPSYFWNMVGLTAAVFYVMTGFVAFCMAWIPGVALGCIFGRAIKRTDQNSTKT